MPRLQRDGEVVHVAFDASKNMLVAGILRPGEETPTIERVFNDEPSVRRFVKGFPEPDKLRTCYEAGPCGYELHRLLHSLGVGCRVIAPAHPGGAWGPGEDRQARRKASGAPVPGWRVGRHPGAEPPGRGGA